MTITHVEVDGVIHGVGVAKLIHEPPRPRCQYGSGRFVKSCPLPADEVFQAPVSHVSMALCSGHLAIISAMVRAVQGREPLKINLKESK